MGGDERTPWWWDRRLHTGLIALVLVGVAVAPFLLKSSKSSQSSEPSVSSESSQTSEPSQPSESSQVSESPSPSPPSTWACVTSDPAGACGAYDFDGIVNSNGYNTYVVNNCWADPSCEQTISADSPAHWQVVANEPTGNTAVKTYPDVQQLFNNWCGQRQWKGCSDPTDTPLSALSSLEFGYEETMPKSSDTIAQAAYDIWTSNKPHNEVMIWTDNHHRGSGGATFVETYRTADGSTWSLYTYGDSEVIWSLADKGRFAQRSSYADVPVHELLQRLVVDGLLEASDTVSEIDFGWEVCSTGGRPQTFSLTDYSIKPR